jgi:hypothetical protein
MKCLALNIFSITNEAINESQNAISLSAAASYAIFQTPSLRIRALFNNTLLPDDLKKSMHEIVEPAFKDKAVVVRSSAFCFRSSLRIFVLRDFGIPARAASTEDSIYAFGTFRQSFDSSVVNSIRGCNFFGKP